MSEVDEGEKRYEVKIVVGPCYEDDAVSLAYALETMVGPWKGQLTLVRLEGDDGPNTPLIPPRSSA